MGKLRLTGLLLGLCFSIPVCGDQTIYDDSLSNGWQNYGWGTLNYNDTAYVHSGTKAISVSGAAWEAIYWGHAPFNSGSFTNLTFWINGGASGGQLLQVQAQLGGAPQPAYNLTPLVANTWHQFSIPLSALGAANKSNLDGFWIQDRSGAAFSAFYVDDVRLLSGVTPPSPPLVISIDAKRNRKTISPYIYGVAFATSNALADLNVPLNRSGGNATTRYNWQQNSFQTAFDWFFQSLPYASATPGAEADDFINGTRLGGAEPMITIPTMGWVADIPSDRSKRWSFSVAKYGAQTETEFSYTGGAPWASPDAGNGISAATSTLITSNNPTDANLAVTSTFQRGWLQHLTNRWSTGANGGVRYYMLDNEPSLWHSTHRDVFRSGATMEQVRDRMIEYGALVKSIDINALIFGPEEWGWSGYFYSGYDQQYMATNGYSVFPDKVAHGNQDYLPWLLDQMRRTNVATGQRLLDVFTVHYYPQGGEFSSNVEIAMQERRNRSTRSLWDPEYSDESWIGTTVHLIPRLHGWVQTNYPGTKVGITEYSWGADDHINGATAQADLLGIFGREGLDYATRWTSPEPGTPVYKAFKLYRNYDGLKSTFGDQSVLTQTPNPDEVSAFGSIRASDGKLTLMVINKAFITNSATLQITNFVCTNTATVWQLTGTNDITRRPDISNPATNFSYSFPPQSITLFVLTQRIPAPPQLQAVGIVNTNFSTLLNAEPGFTYQIERSIDLLTWTNVSVHFLSTNTVEVVAPISAQSGFYRARLEP